MSFDIQLMNGSGALFTFEDAVQNALDPVAYGNAQPDDILVYPFGNYNLDGTRPIDHANRTLYSNGCRQPDGSVNCTAACLLPNTTFGDMYTLQNCVVYPRISESLAANNATDQAELIANQFGIVGDLSIRNLIHNTTYDCLSDLCGTITTPGAICVVDSVCNSVPVTVSSDVGGIGVYISYWMQNVISAMGGFLLKLLTSWIYYISLAILTIPFGYPRAKEMASAVRKKAIDGPLQVLLAALVEFQKAQCFFLIAVEIAAQVVIRKGFIDSANLSELWNTYAMINIISTSSCLPVSFTLFCLHTSGMESWYLSTLTLCTVIIATATGFLSSTFQPSAGAIQRLGQTTSNFARCGYRNPVAFCQTAYAPYDGFVGGYANTASLYSLIVTAILMVIQGVRCFKARQKSTYQKITRGMRLAARSVGLETIYRRVKPTVPKRIRNNMDSFFYFALWVLFVCWFFNFLDGLISFLPEHLYTTTPNQSKAIDTSNWGFGQIVAITVWAVPLFEYLHLSIRGMKPGTEYRTPPGYELVRKHSLCSHPSTPINTGNAGLIISTEAPTGTTSPTVNGVPALMSPSKSTSIILEKKPDGEGLQTPATGERPQTKQDAQLLGAQL